MDNDPTKNNLIIVLEHILKSIEVFCGSVKELAELQKINTEAIKEMTSMLRNHFIDEYIKLEESRD